VGPNLLLEGGAKVCGGFMDGTKKEVRGLLVNNFPVSQDTKSGK